MKKIILITLPLLVVIVTAIVFYHDITALFEARQPSGAADSLITELPSDPAKAKKEMQRLQKALASIKPRGQYIVVDTHANILYLRTEDAIIVRATCSTGFGGELVDSVSGKKWVFDTPKGVFKINSKLENPWWRKPDWAFIESGEPIPSDPRERFDPNVLGEFALGFGNGYFIHGTLYTRLLGVSVSHGCVRLGNDDLQKIFQKVAIGTPVYVI